MKHSHVPLQRRTLAHSSTYTRVKQTVWEDSGLCTHTVKNIHAPASYSLCCPSIMSLSTALPILYINAVHTHSLKNHHLEYKVLLAWWGAPNSPHFSGLSNHFHICCRSADVCECDWECMQSGVWLCVMEAPPDYSYSIINSDQICFVA